MKVMKFLVITFIMSFAFLAGIETVNGKTHGEKQLEEFIKGNNYIPAEKAIHQYEKEHGRKVNLPTNLPFEPTHRFGTVDGDGRLNLHYMKYDVTGRNTTLDFVFYVMPEKDLGNFINQTKDEVHKLSNGSKAYYRNYHEDFHTLVFQKSGFGYLLGGSTIDDYDIHVLKKIADSIK